MTRPVLAIAAVGLPPLVLAGVGLTHPSLLTVESAVWWTTMHLVLVPLFPLLGVVVWVLLRNDRTAVGWAGRVAAVTYAVFYTGLDAVSGIAAGTVVQAGAVPGSDVVDSLFAVGRVLGIVGGFAFLVAVILVLGSAWRRDARGWKIYVAAVVLLAAGYLFLRWHIYWPRGVFAMIGFAIGFVLLELSLRAPSARRSAPQ